MSDNSESNVVSEGAVADQTNSGVVETAPVEIPPAAPTPNEPPPSETANEEVAEQEEPVEPKRKWETEAEFVAWAEDLEAKVTKLIAQTRHMV